MALKFGDEELDTLVNDHFRPAVAATGYALMRADDFTKTGRIDDLLRVEIRASRFVIADLTHSNKGVCWEAGFAEGLGKPVIFTCKDSAFDEGVIHFDLNHQIILKWTPNDVEDFTTRLKATIRVAVPEAKQRD